MFSKIFYFIFVLFASMFLLVLNFSKVLSVSDIFSFSLDEKINFFYFSFSFEFVSIFFLMMVSLVTSLVFLYSEVYMESYSNKKFFYLTLLFFSFMSVLSLSGSIMTALIGWDGLGISSLFLIMFYPNKITYFNSFLTFFFNRMGDIFFLVFFLFYMSNYSLFFSYMSLDSFLISFFFFLCLMTKSAQFPFSSWLPAAMSAPTPISAMVHSSTLVTAGILILMKLYNFFLVQGFMSLLLVLSVSTFLLGGVLGVLEIDLKKIVAFSTMSQISMILFFISVELSSLALLHTLGHALFKTLLFCACGVLFLWNFSDQNLKNLTSKNYYLSCVFLFVVSIYSMSGVCFSSSFFTKDLVLEKFLESKNFYFFIFLLLGSFMTIIYSSKIFSSLQFNPTVIPNFSHKISHFIFIFFFMLSVILLVKIFLFNCFMGLNCYISCLEVMFCSVLIPLFFFIKIFSKKLNILSLEILFLKTTSFGLMNKFQKGLPNDFYINDSLFFKPTTFNFKSLNVGLKVLKFWMYPIFLIFMFFYF